MQKPGHRKNPAAVALGRLGGLAGRGKAKARKVTSEMARRAVMARWAKARLLLLFLGLLAPAAYSQGSLQGIFSYTYTGDTSPWGVSAAFMATGDAVSTGVLRTTNIVSGGYMQMGDRRVPIYSMYFPVHPGNGNPLSTDYIQWLTVNGLFGVPYPATDWVVIADGAEGYASTIYRQVYPSDDQSWRSEGRWSVTLVPEPSSLSLLLLAIAGWEARRLARLPLSQAFTTT